MASTYAKTILADKIKESTSSAEVSFPDGLKTDTIKDVSAGGLTVTPATTFSDDVTIGSGGSPKDLTVHRDVLASRDVTAPNLIVGRKYNIDYTDLSSGSTTETLDLGTVGKWMPIRAYVTIVTPFAATGLSALTWTVGWTNGSTVSVDTDGILLTGDSDGTTAANYQLEDSHKGASLDGTADYPLQSDNHPSVTFTATGANLDTLTAGVMRVTIFWARDPEFY